MKSNEPHNAKIIYQLADVIGSLDLQHLFDKALHFFLDEIQCYDAAIFIYQENYSQLVCKSYQKFSEKNKNNDYLLKTIAFGDGVIGKAAQQQTSIIISDTSQCDYYLHDKVFNKSELAVPLIHNKKLIGVIDFESNQKDFFTLEKASFVESFVKILIPAIVSLQSRDNLAYKIESEDIKSKVLLEKELLYKSIVCNAGDAIVLHDLNGKIEDANNQAVVSLGYSLSELKSMSLRDFGCFLADNSADFRSVCLAIKPDEPYKYQSIHRRRDGITFPVEVKMSLLPTGSIVSIIRDITERVNTIKKLEDAHNFLEKLIETLPSVVYVYDVEKNQITEGAAKLAALLGYETPAVVDWNLILELIHPQDREIIDTRNNKVFSSNLGDVVQSTFRIKKQDGTWAWLLNKNRIIKSDSSGNPLLEVGSVDDISILKNTEQNLIKKQGLYRGLIENAFDGVILYDQEGNTKFTTRNTLKVLGFDETATKGINGFEYVYSEDQEKIRQAWDFILKNPNVSKVLDAFRIYKFDGELIWVEAVITNLCNDPTIKGVVANFRDVSQQHATEVKLEQKSAYFESLVENSYEGLTLYNEQSQVLYVSSSTKKIMGLAIDDLANFSVLDVIEPEDLPIIRHSWQECLKKPGETIKVPDYRLIGKDGKRIWIENSLQNLLHDPSVNAVISNFRDITEKKLAEQTVLKRERYFRSLVEHSFDGIVLYSIDGDTIYRSKNARKMLAIEDPVPASIERYNAVHDDDVELVEAGWNWIKKHPASPYKVPAHRMLLANNQYLWVESTLTNLIDDADIEGVVCNFRDISYSKMAEQNLYKISNYDRLTKLPNRAFLVKHLKRQIELTNITKEKLSLVCFDIEQLNAINNVFSHTIGDKVLHKVAESIKSKIDDFDFLARSGNDEFAILLLGKDGFEASKLTELILNQFESIISIDAEDIKVNLRAGISRFPDDSRDAIDLISKAEIAVSRAKKTSLPFAFFQQQDGDTINYKLNLEKDLIKALNKNQLELFYQPKVCMQSGRVSSVEALLRWQHPEKGFIPTQVIINIAEETRLIHKLTLWVLNQAIKQSSEWLAQGLEIQVGINLSAKDLQQEGFESEIKMILQKYNLPSNLLEVEITESAAMADLQKSVDVLGKISKMGISIALDDFGTGYSSISYLSNLPVDIVKVDRSFIKDIANEKKVNQKKNYLVIQNIIKLTESFNLVAVVEGIETIEQYKALKDFNCQFGQGYFFSRPKAANKIFPILSKGLIDNLDQL